MYRQIYPDAKNGHLYEGARIQHYYYIYIRTLTHFPFPSDSHSPPHLIFDFLSPVFLSFLECCEALLVIDARLQQPLG